MEVIYLVPKDSYLMHHGVKGMKWGVRNSIQTEGYRKASIYMQRRDIRNLKRQKRSSGMTNDAYKARKAQIKHKAMAERGKRLVENNQTHGKIAAKSVAKTAAIGLGTAAVTGFAFGAGAGFVAPVAVGMGVGMAGSTIHNDIRKHKEISAYRRR